MLRTAAPEEPLALDHPAERRDGYGPAERRGGSGIEAGSMPG
jgi:hypothetical protein